MVFKKIKKRAVYYYRLAANQQDDFAQENLGSCYEYGEGIDKDPNEAIYLYRLAAAQGNKSAEETLRNIAERI